MAAKPYDPTLKALVEIEPESWAELVGGPLGPTTVIDADIATISGAGDKALRIEADPPYILHLEFAAGHDGASLPLKLHVRNGLLEYRHELLVRSVAIVLRPEADSPRITGIYERSFPRETHYLQFRYQSIRVWQLPPERLLEGGIGLLALAPISDVTQAALPGIIKQMDQRLRHPRERKHASRVWAAAYVLSGLRYSPQLAASLFQRMVSMKESSTYQAILEEGRNEGRAEGQSEGALAEVKKLLRRLGEKALGTPDVRTVKAIEKLNDVNRLEELCERVSTARSWQELMRSSTTRPDRKA